jgi:hypothetical protein
LKLRSQGSSAAFTVSADFAGDLEDLEITQYLFAGDEVTNPSHVSIIANNVHHCMFKVPGPLRGNWTLAPHRPLARETPPRSGYVQVGIEEVVLRGRRLGAEIGVLCSRIVPLAARTKSLIPEYDKLSDANEEPPH